MTKPLDGWFFGTAKQYVVAPDGTEYWPRTEMNKRIDAAMQKQFATEGELARVRGLLQRQWISVEERLPEKWQRVLIWVFVSPDHLGHFVAWVNSRGEWCDAISTYKPGAVTHWSPLLDPPTFPQSSELVPSGSESADIGKLDTVDKSGVEMGKVNRVPEKCRNCGWQVCLVLGRWRHTDELMPDGTCDKPEPPDYEKQIENIYNAVAKSVLELTDEQIIQETRDAGLDPTVEAERVCQVIQRAGSAEMGGEKADKESVAIAFGWQNFVAGKTIQCAYDTGEWAVIQFTDGTKLEIVSNALHMIEAARQ